MDITRERDLEELDKAKDKATSVEEKEKLDKLMYDIREQDDEDVNKERKELLGSIRVHDGKHARVVSNRIKVMTHRKGLERNG